MSARIPLPMPFGWFRMSESTDLSVGDVKTVHYLGQEFLLYRGADGEANVIDPYCPHLGAHLGYGGVVEGNDIRCPFHHWKFNGSSGQCVEVPYAKRIPDKARIKSYPTCEKNGILFAWHHPHGDPPKWELPEVPDWGAEGWMEPIYHTVKVKSHAQEMAENVVDSPHFHFVHGTPDIPEKTFTFEGHIMRAFQGLTFKTPDGDLKGSVDIESHGGSVGITRFQGIGETLIIITGTPVDEDLHETVMRFSFKIMDGNLEATKGLAKAFIGEVTRQHAQDIPIWEHKKFHQNPVLCDGDGPIHSIRKYYQQFYAESVTSE